MIRLKIFVECLQICEPKCKRPLLNPWHDCIKLPRRTYKLSCISKKKSALDLQSDDSASVAWGIEADYALSFASVAFHH